MISINIEPQHIQSLFTVHFFVRDHQVHAVARRDKTCPRIQKHLQNPKHVPQSSNTSENSKTHPRIQNTSQNPEYVPETKTLPRIQHTSQNPKYFPESKSVLESRKYFEFLGVFLVFWDGFWILAKVLGFWDVFWILGSVLFLWATVSSGAFCKEWPPWWIST